MYAFFYIIIAIIVTILFNKSNKIIFGFLSIILVLMYCDLNINPVFLILAGLAGAITEMIIIYFTTDIWKYRTPDIINKRLINTSPNLVVPAFSVVLKLSLDFRRRIRQTLTHRLSLISLGSFRHPTGAYG